MIGALCAAGVPPWFMVAHSAGETFDGLVDARGRPAAEADRSAGARLPRSSAAAADRAGLVARWRCARLRRPRRYTARRRAQPAGCRAG